MYSIFTFLNFFLLFSKNSFFIVFLLNLNNFLLNILILLVIFTSLCITVNLRLPYLVYLYLMVVKKKKICFILLFFYGFFKFHILCTYLSFITGIALLIYSILTLKVRINSIVLSLIISLILGSLWSLFLFNWGYYWTNDSIEYALLIGAIIFLYYIHTKHVNTMFMLYFLISLALLVYLLRASLINTRHNFFENSVNIYLFFKFFITLTTICLLHYTRKRGEMVTYNVMFYLIFILIYLNILNCINYSLIKIFMYKLFTVNLLYLFNLNVWIRRFKIMYHIFIYIVLLLYVLLSLQYLFNFNNTLMSYIYIHKFNNEYVQSLHRYGGVSNENYQNNLKLIINKNFNYSSLTNFYRYYLKKTIINYL